MMDTSLKFTCAPAHSVLYNMSGLSVPPSDAARAWLRSADLGLELSLMFTIQVVLLPRRARPARASKSWLQTFCQKDAAGEA